MASVKWVWFWNVPIGVGKSDAIEFHVRVYLMGGASHNSKSRESSGITSKINVILESGIKLSLLM